MTPFPRSRELISRTEPLRGVPRHRFHHFDGPSASTMQERSASRWRGVGSVPAAVRPVAAPFQPREQRPRLGGIHAAHR